MTSWHAEERLQQAMIDRSVTRIARDVAFAAIILGLMVRVWNLLRTPLWLDEAYSRFAAERSWWFLWHVVPRYETHPPFYYSLLHLWRAVAGDSLLALRLPGLACGFATIAVTGLAARTLADRLAAAPAARAVMIAFAIAYAALAPMLIDMSRQVRPYAPMILVYAVATLALLRLADDSAARRPLARGGIAGFFFAEALMLWLHALGPLFAVAMTAALAIVVLRRDLRRADWAWLAVGQVAAGLLYLPAFVILLGQAPDWVRSTWLTFEPRTLPLKLAMLFAAPTLWLFLCATVAFLGGLVVIARQQQDRRAPLALLVMAGVPVLLSLALSWWVAPVFLPRTLSPTVIPFALIVAMAAIGAWPRGAAPALLALLLGLSAWYDLDYAARLPGEDWYAAADWITPRVAPGDAVWAYPNETALPLGYALADRSRSLPIRQIPAPVPALGVPGEHITGNGGVVALDTAGIARLAADPATGRIPTIWLVGVGAERVDPDDRLLHALLRTRRLTASYRDGEVRMLGLTIDQRTGGTGG